MPVMVKRTGEKWRVVGARSQQPETNAEGTPVDGGGHQTQEAAEAQARAINAAGQSRGGLLEAVQAGQRGFFSLEAQPARTVLLEVEVGASQGPWPGLQRVPVELLEAVPAPFLAGLRDARALHYAPIKGVRVRETPPAAPSAAPSAAPPPPAPAPGGT